MNSKGWIGVDLDGTLAKYTKFTGETQIGAPVPLMVARVKEWLKQGREVRIFTARVADPDNLEAVKKAIEFFCVTHIGQRLKITCRKDHMMDQLWDDRAVQVIHDTGKMAEGPEWHENMLQELAETYMKNVKYLPVETEES